jgi:hypothetical protein
MWLPWRQGYRRVEICFSSCNSSCRLHPRRRARTRPQKAGSAHEQNVRLPNFVGLFMSSLPDISNFFLEQERDFAECGDLDFSHGVSRGFQGCRERGSGQSTILAYVRCTCCAVVSGPACTERAAPSVCNRCSTDFTGDAGSCDVIRPCPCPS